MDLQKEREAFEAWYCKNHTGLKQSDLAKFRTLSDYSFSDSLKINIAWEAWQAAKAVQECAWLQNEDGYFDTSCSQSFVFSEPDDRPHAHQFTYCCFCGGKLIEAQGQANESE